MDQKGTFLLGIILAITCHTSFAKSVGNEVDSRIRSGEDLVSQVLDDCSSLYCVKDKVLNYLDSLLGLREEEERSYQEDDIDEKIYNRVAKLFQTRQFKATLPGNIDVSYNPYTGLDIDMPVQPTDDETTAQARGLLKKKLLLPVLLLLKLKLKALMPIFVAIIGLKSLKALVLSKLAFLLVAGFIGYQLYMQKNSAMAMQMTMAPAEPPASAYGVPESTTPASSYQPSWEPSGGPYSRIWTSSGAASDASNLAYSAYYPSSGSSSSSSS